MTGRKISGKGGRMKHAALLPTLSGLLALAACATQPPITTNCPNVAVLEQGSTMTVFLPGRQDIAAEITHAQITGVAGSCTLEKKKKELRVTFQAGFAATKGPASTSPTLVLPYLVSLSQDDNIVRVTDYAIPLTFDGIASAAAATTKPFNYVLPNVPETATLDILVSFHLSPAQLAYNNSHPGQ
jgi:hypothetical protein